jgi:CheY-like chemotaxis protein
LLREELEAYGQTPSIVTFAGIDAALTPKSALALSLALHELSTNAAKYGAFSVAAGQVAITWHLADDGGLVLLWTESGGPPVSEPTHRGFGSNLIERALSMETGGRAAIFFKPSGVVCEIVLPKSSLVELHIVPIPISPPVFTEVALTALPARPKLLIVEDSFLVILELEGMCEDLGWDMIGPATRLTEGIALARTGTFDVALVDVNLNGEMSWAIADVLVARSIPFAFSTGYDQARVLPAHLAEKRTFAKPYRIEQVAHGLRQIMALT